jgi:AraC-like DNA-binding protein
MFPDFNSNPGLKFALSDNYPVGYKGPILSGAAVRTANSSQGMVIMQELITCEEGSVIELSYFYFLKRCILPFRQNNNTLNLPIALQNKFLFRIKGIRNILLRKGCYILLHFAGRDFEMVFEKETEYMLFNICFSEKKITEMEGVFPELLRPFFDKLLEKKPFAFSKIARVPKKAGSIPANFLNLKYLGKPTNFQLEKKTELLLSSLFIKEEERLSRPDPSAITADALEKLNYIEKILTKDIHKRYSISELSRKVGMNRNKFGDFFKKLFGKGVAEYQQEIKMHEAKRIIVEEGRAVKDASLSTGHKNLQHFSTQFKKFFGKNPSSLKKKNKKD